MATESKHTAGPWSLGVDRRGDRMVFGSCRHLATVPIDQLDPKEDRANARLIAAAPDLLEALTVMLKGDEMGEYECQRQGFPRLSKRWEMARAAIAKAEGR